MFGIVKTAHKSKLGNVQKMSYQMVNSLDEEAMDSICAKSVEYVGKLKNDLDTFLEYLRRKTNYSNDYEVLLALVEQNPAFADSDYFKERKHQVIKSYIKGLKSGELIQYADNLVIVGSPYAMLLYAASGNPDDVDNDTTFTVEEGTIQCYNKKFNDGEYLAFFRSPFNAKNNLTYLHNVRSELMDKYFELGDLCIAINMNGTDTQDRNNGSDQDSDSGYTTNQPAIVECAKRYYIEYPTIVNNISKDKNKYSSSMLDFARMDNMLSASQTDIGESSNLAQIAQSYVCNFDDPKLQEYVCILSVVAQAAIDSAKRRFDIDITSEIKRIKADMGISNVVKNKQIVKEGRLYPKFWASIRREFNKDLINPDLHCPMNYLCDLTFDRVINYGNTLPISYFFKSFPLDVNKKTCKQVEEMISKYSLRLKDNLFTRYDSEDDLLLRSDFDDLANTIGSMNISGNYLGLFSWLIDRAFRISGEEREDNAELRSVLHKNKSLLIKVLYTANKNNLLKCFSNNLPES